MIFKTKSSLTDFFVLCRLLILTSDRQMQLLTFVVTFSDVKTCHVHSSYWCSSFIQKSACPLQSHSQHVSSFDPIWHCKWMTWRNRAHSFHITDLFVQHPISPSNIRKCSHCSFLCQSHSSEDLMTDEAKCNRLEHTDSRTFTFLVIMSRSELSSEPSTRGTGACVSSSRPTRLSSGPFCPLCWRQNKEENMLRIPSWWQSGFGHGVAPQAWRQKLHLCVPRIGPLEDSTPMLQTLTKMTNPAAGFENKTHVALKIKCNTMPKWWGTNVVLHFGQHEHLWISVRFHKAFSPSVLRTNNKSHDVIKHCTSLHWHLGDILLLQNNHFQLSLWLLLGKLFVIDCFFVCFSLKMTSTMSLQHLMNLTKTKKLIRIF